MKTRWLVGSLLVVSLTLPPGLHAAQASDNRYIVRLNDGLTLPVIKLVCSILGCRVQQSLDTDPAGGLLQSGSSLFLVDSILPIDLNAFLSFPLRLLGVASVERDLPVQVAEGPQADTSDPAVQDYLWRRTPTPYFGTTVWQGYLQQPAISIVRLPEAQCDRGATGSGVLVAVIDTGVDPKHPALSSVLKSGYDFTRNVPGGDETADVTQEQESVALVDGATACRVNQESVALVDQESTHLVDDPDHKAFGHGTMVAGVVHLVAPSAKIMPLKAFSADGMGYTSDIVRAIYYATKKGAKVVNMSFSRPTSSPELKRALDYATAFGVIPISSAGNEGTSALRYPAAYSTVVGVASTSNLDTRSTFSNYGKNLVWLAAPGEGIVTTYPNQTYAAAWGTSFSTPFVSGAAALLVGVKSTARLDETAWALSHAKPLGSDLGYGRLDISDTLNSGKLLWPWLLFNTSSSGACGIR